MARFPPTRCKAPRSSDGQHGRSRIAAAKGDFVANESARHASEAQLAILADAQKKKSEFISLVLKYRDKLEQVYAAATSDEQKRAAKTTWQ